MDMDGVLLREEESRFRARITFLERLRELAAAVPGPDEQLDLHAA